MFRPITLNQLKSLTSINMLSYLGVLEVTHRTAVCEVPGSIAGSGKGFYFFVLFLLSFLLFVQNTLTVMQLCNSLCNGNLFSLTYILQNV